MKLRLSVLTAVLAAALVSSLPLQAAAREGGHDAGRGGRIHAQAVAHVAQRGSVFLEQEHDHPELLRAEAVPGHAPAHRLLQAAAGHRDQASQ